MSNRFPMIRQPRRLLVSLVLSFLLVPAPLIADDDALATARAEFQTGELLAARLRLKELLQYEPGNGQGRLLLARTYLDLRDGAAAEQELNRARSAGVAEAEVAPLMAKALLLQRQFARLIDATELDAGEDPALRADLLALKAHALAALDERARADVAIDQALRIDPDSVSALVVKADLVLDMRGAEAARAIVEQALDVDPDASDALELLGDLAVVEGRYQDAVVAFSAAESAATDKWMLRYKRALARIETGDLSGAQADIERAHAIFPSFAALLYARGRLALARQDWDAAYRLLDEFGSAAKSAPPIVSYYAGVAAYKLGYFEQAKEYLSSYVTQAPDSDQAAVLLALTSLHLGDSEDAEQVIRPFAQSDKPSPEALRVLGAALERQGRVDEAKRIARRLIAAAPSDTAMRLSLVDNLLKQGDTRSAGREIERLHDIEPDDPGVRFARVRYEIAAGDTDAALSAATAFVGDAPNNARAYQALGAARWAAGDVAGAKASLEKALALSPGLSAVAMKLAQIDRAAGRTGEARSRYEAILSRDPVNPAAVLALAQMDVAAGQPAAAQQRLEAALRDRPDSVELRLNLANGYLREGRVAAAKQLLVETPGDVADDPRILAARVKGELLVGQPYNAIGTAERFVASYPNSASAQYLLARTLAAANRSDGVRDALLEGFRLDPDQADAVPSLVTIFDASDDVQRATLLDGMRRLHPDHPVTKLLQARNSLVSGDRATALRLLDELRDNEPGNPVFFEALFRAQVDAKDVAAAILTGQRWLAAHPEDNRTRLRLAQLYAETGRTGAAVSAYRKVLESQPDSPVVLNNLAELLTSTRPSEAVVLARRAHLAQPDSPAIADTLGMALLAAGDGAAARALLEDAHETLPANATITMHYAQALLATGERGLARQLLLAIANKPFAGSRQVAQLLEQLR